VANFQFRILVVDDDEAIRRVSQDVFSHCGYEVRTAKDGFDALVIMRKALPDLLISDLKMPNMSGFELLSIVRRRFPQIPVIAITGEFVGAADPQGLLADAFFHKGQYAPEELFKRIQSLLEESPLRPHLAKPDKAPVWIPRNGTYYVLTCPECLRSFSIPTDEPDNNAPREMPCIFCTAPVRFILEPNAGA
jgi:CheY-like chemotaxis protein